MDLLERAARRHQQLERHVVFSGSVLSKGMRPSKPEDAVFLRPPPPN
jgi:hypothetical protein